MNTNGRRLLIGFESFYILQSLRLCLHDTRSRTRAKTVAIDLSCNFVTDLICPQTNAGPTRGRPKGVSVQSKFGNTAGTTERTNT